MHRASRGVKRDSDPRLDDLTGQFRSDRSGPSRQRTRCVTRVWSCTRVDRGCLQIALVLRSEESVGQGPAPDRDSTDRPLGRSQSRQRLGEVATRAPSPSPPRSSRTRRRSHSAIQCRHSVEFGFDAETCRNSGFRGQLQLDHPSVSNVERGFFVGVVKRPPIRLDRPRSTFDTVRGRQPRFTPSNHFGRIAASKPSSTLCRRCDGSSPALDRAAHDRGLARSAQNASRHGLYATAVLAVAGAPPEEFDAHNQGAPGDISVARRPR